MTVSVAASVTVPVTEAIDCRCLLPLPAAALTLPLL